MARRRVQDTSSEESLIAESNLFPGKFGYRTREGQTGLDPMDTYREWGWAQGMFYKHLITLQLRTRYLPSLIFMTLGGLMLLCPAIATIIDRADPSTSVFHAAQGSELDLVICGGALFVSTAGGVLLLINVALSLLQSSEEEN